MRISDWSSDVCSSDLMACALIELGADTTVASILRKEAKARIALAQRILNLDEVPMPDGAPHIWLPMSPVRAEKLARRASEQCGRLTPPAASFVGGDCAGGVRLSIMAQTTRADLERSLRWVAELPANAAETGVP